MFGGENVLIIVNKDYKFEILVLIPSSLINFFPREMEGIILGEAVLFWSRRLGLFTFDFG